MRCFECSRPAAVSMTEVKADGTLGETHHACSDALHQDALEARMTGLPHPSLAKPDYVKALGL